MKFSKYNASGNDFVIFHTFLKESRGELARMLCDRHSGIGADGLIVLIPHSEYDFEWEFYNSDGSNAGMCGNGSRAAAHYAFKYKLAQNDMKFLTDAGVIEANVDGNEAEVKLTKPKVLDELIVAEGKKWILIDTGVPHLVTFVDDLDSFDKDICKLMRDKFDANVNYAKVDPDRKSIEIRTYERGVEDETLACGTGMAAAFYAAYKNGDVLDTTSLYPKSKEELRLSLRDDFIYFKGSVEEVFITNIDI